MQTSSCMSSALRNQEKASELPKLESHTIPESELRSFEEQ